MSRFTAHATISLPMFKMVTQLLKRLSRTGIEDARQSGTQAQAQAQAQGANVLVTIAAANASTLPGAPRGLPQASLMSSASDSGQKTIINNHDQAETKSLPPIPMRVTGTTCTLPNQNRKDPNSKFSLNTSQSTVVAATWKAGAMNLSDDEKGDGSDNELDFSSMKEKSSASKVGGVMDTSSKYASLRSPLKPPSLTICESRGNSQGQASLPSVPANFQGYAPTKRTKKVAKAKRPLMKKLKITKKKLSPKKITNRENPNSIDSKGPDQEIQQATQEEPTKLKPKKQTGKNKRKDARPAVANNNESGACPHKRGRQKEIETSVKKKKSNLGTSSTIGEGPFSGTASNLLGGTDKKSPTTREGTTIPSQDKNRRASASKEMAAKKMDEEVDGSTNLPPEEMRQFKSTLSTDEEIKEIVAFASGLVASELRSSAWQLCSKKSRIVFNKNKDDPSVICTSSSNISEVKSPGKKCDLSTDMPENGTVTANSSTKSTLSPTAKNCANGDKDNYHAISLVVERFALEVYYPFLIASKKAMRNESPRSERVLVSTLLAIREMLIMNGAKFFSLSAMVRSTIAVHKSHQGNMDYFTFLACNIASLIVRLAAYRVRHLQQGEQFYAAFFEAARNYDLNSDDFQFSLRKADARSTYVLPEGSTLSHEESMVMKVSFNMGRARHPLIYNEPHSQQRDANNFVLPRASVCTAFIIEADLLEEKRATTPEISHEDENDAKQLDLYDKLKKFQQGRRQSKMNEVKNDMPKLSKSKAISKPVR